MKLLNNRYQIIETIGQGGFGETFLARDTHLPSARQCVIKHLQPVLQQTESIPPWLQERFQREAAILEELGENHGQIPQLYAYFSEGDDFYLVQEWIPGLTLTQAQVKKGNFSSTAVEELLLGILPVLEFIHQRRIIHRDIKPDNIILRQGDGKPILIDFGIIKETMGTLVNADGRSAYSVALGTPGYMASEQAAGRPVFSSDLYSLGLTAIFLLTGKSPQYLTTDSRTGEIIWRSAAPQVSPTLAAVLDRAIRYHPRERFSSAREMAQALFGSFYSLNGAYQSVGQHYSSQGNAPRTAPTLVVGTPYNANDSRATTVHSQEFTDYGEEEESSPLVKWVVMPLVFLLVIAGGMAGGFWVTQQRQKPPQLEPEPTPSELPSPLPSFAPSPNLFETPSPRPRPPEPSPTPTPTPTETVSPEPEPSPSPGEETIQDLSSPEPEIPEESPPPLEPSPTEPPASPSPEPMPSPGGETSPKPSPPRPSPVPSSPKPSPSKTPDQPSNPIPVIPPPEKPGNEPGNPAIAPPGPPLQEKPVNPGGGNN